MKNSHDPLISSPRSLEYFSSKRSIATKWIKQFLVLIPRKFRAIKRKVNEGDWGSIGFAVLEFSVMVIGFILCPVLIIVLWLLKPFLWVRIGRLESNSMGMLSLDPHLFINRMRRGVLPKEAFYFFIAYKRQLCNQQMMRMIKRELNVCVSTFLDWCFRGMEPIFQLTPFFVLIEASHQEYYEYKNSQPSLKFTEKELEKGRKVLAEMGLQFQKDNFVCIHARDSAYHIARDIGPPGVKSFHRNEYRNTDINTYREAIDFLVEKGRFVIRVGAIAESPLNYKHPKVIDYTFSKYQSDFMDIFLVANCELLLGSASGGCDISGAFGVPRIGVNFVPIGITPLSRCNLYIPRKIRDRNTKVLVSYLDVLSRGGGFFENTDLFHSLGLAYEDNSPRDIRLAVEEMFERIHGRFKMINEDRCLKRKYLEQFCPKVWGAGRDSYRLEIGLAWLRENRGLYFEDQNICKD
jgi:putative glycosyltransferase (TIGR04372 family)